MVWLGVPGGMESRLVPAERLSDRMGAGARLRGKGSGWALAPLRRAGAVLEALQVLRRVRPGVVLGAGRLVSGPGRHRRLAARIPLLIHEQNAVAGIDQPLPGVLRERVLEAFPGSSAGAHARAIGNPVRAEIAELPGPPAALRKARATGVACWCLAAARARSA